MSVTLVKRLVPLFSFIVPSVYVCEVLRVGWETLRVIFPLLLRGICEVGNSVCVV